MSGSLTPESMKGMASGDVFEKLFYNRIIQVDSSLLEIKKEGQRSRIICTAEPSIQVNECKRISSIIHLHAESINIAAEHFMSHGHGTRIEPV